MSSILVPLQQGSAAGTPNISGGVTVSGGVTISGLVGISGGGLTISGGVTISGLVGISGGGLTVSGGMTVSGGVTVSGNVSITSGNIYVTSGLISFYPSTRTGNNYVLEVGNATLSTAASGVGMGSFASGGVTLASCGPLISVTLRSVSGNSAILVGGTTTTNAPSVATANVAAPGVGIELFANESLTLKVSNTNLINVMNETAGTSGQRVTIVGVAQT